MIDTVKLGIPLTAYQLERLYKRQSQDDNWQWIQLQPSTGETRFMRVKGLAQLDRPSFHRDIAWYIPDHYIPGENFLTVELSVPKFYYGHNILLLYDFVNALRELKKIFEKQLHCKFVDVLEWKVFRVDVCYAWDTPSQGIAQQILDSLKRINYPRKKPIIYNESILFAGATYSLKFYLKYPEFLQHDKKALIKSKASIEWIDYLEKRARGVLRCEATLRRKYLVRQGIETVADLARPNVEFELDEEFVQLNQDRLEDTVWLAQAIKTLVICKLLESGFDVSSFYMGESEIPSEYKLEDGKVFTSPAITVEADDGVVFKHNGGGFVVRKRDNPTTILQYFINRFIGENRGMDTAEQVRSKLLEEFKPSKAARLLGFWFHIQKFGSGDAKQIYGKTLYYDSRADLKAAGVSLVEPPKVVTAGDHFLESFRLDVPSSHATNQLDEYRDSGNVLNLPRQATD